MHRDQEEQLHRISLCTHGQGHSLFWLLLQTIPAVVDQGRIAVQHQSVKLYFNYIT